MNMVWRQRSREQGSGLRPRGEMRTPPPDDQTASRRRRKALPRSPGRTALKEAEARSRTRRKVVAPARRMNSRRESGPERSRPGPRQWPMTPRPSIESRTRRATDWIRSHPGETGHPRSPTLTGPISTERKVSIQRLRLIPDFDLSILPSQSGVRSPLLTWTAGNGCFVQRPVTTLPATRSARIRPVAVDGSAF